MAKKRFPEKIVYCHQKMSQIVDYNTSAGNGGLNVRGRCPKDRDDEFSISSTRIILYVNVQRFFFHNVKFHF